MTDWCVAIAQHNSHSLALANLDAQDIPSYFPKFRETVASRGRKAVREVYLFGTYFFFELSNKWRSVNGTRGVASIMMWGDSPSRIRDDVIDELRSRQDPEGYVLLPSAMKNADRVVYGKDEEVRAVSGLMFGYNGIVVGMKGHDRVKVLFEMMGRKTQATVSVQDITPA